MSKAIEQRIQQLAEWMNNYEQTVKTVFNNLSKADKKKYTALAGTSSIRMFPCNIIEQMLQEQNVQLSSNWPPCSDEAKKELVLRKRLSIINHINNDDSDEDSMT